MSSNPLESFFRIPGLMVTLPSGGAFTPPGDLELSMNGELAVFPMTGKDEIWSKNPDGLLNGYSIENIIKSCVPGVKNPRKMPSQDIDFLLLAIKRASYGNKLNIVATCPKCGKEHSYECSIDDIMATVRPLESEYVVRLSDELVAKLRPYDYQASTRLNLAAFEESKLFQSIISVDLTEEDRVAIFSKSFEKISNLNLDLLSDCIMSIVGPNIEVSDPRYIKEFVAKADRKFIKTLQEALQVFKDGGIDRTIKLVCATEDCLHEWSTELAFDPAHFFE